MWNRMLPVLFPVTRRTMILNLIPNLILILAPFPLLLIIVPLTNFVSFYYLYLALFHAPTSMVSCTICSSLPNPMKPIHGNLLPS